MPAQIATLEGCAALHANICGIIPMMVYLDIATALNLAAIQLLVSQACYSGRDDERHASSFVGCFSTSFILYSLLWDHVTSGGVL